MNCEQEIKLSFATNKQKACQSIVPLRNFVLSIQVRKYHIFQILHLASLHKINATVAVVFVLTSYLKRSWNEDG